MSEVILSVTVGLFFGICMWLFIKWFGIDK